jgi:biopolymer transport protein ExbD
MAGVDVGGGGKGGRRKLDSEVNMIPFVDLLMVTVSFLLITAVWVHSARMDADAQVPGPPQPTPPCEGEACKPEARLHIDAKDHTKWVLTWKQDGTVVKSTEIPRETKAKAGMGYPQLAAKVSEEWKQTGVHQSASDRKFDHAVVHASNDMPYSELIAVMDAVSQPKRQVQVGEKRIETNALEVTFAAD